MMQKFNISTSEGRDKDLISTTFYKVSISIWLLILKCTHPRGLVQIHKIAKQNNTMKNLQIRSILLHQSNVKTGDISRLQARKQSQTDKSTSTPLTDS